MSELPEFSGSTPPATGVIHDIGYGRYRGPRVGIAGTLFALFTLGVRRLFGFGRSGKAKILPIVIVVFSLVPAIVILGILVISKLDVPILNYASYAQSVQLLTCIFIAAQAPVLFAADQRSGAISLYLARPPSSWGYALTRSASMFAALMFLMVLPLVLIYLGAVLAGLDLSEHTADFLVGLGLVTLLAFALTGVSAAIASWATGRGFAVLAIIAALLVADAIATAMRAVAEQNGAPTVGALASLASPYSTYRGLVSFTSDAGTTLDGWVQVLYWLMPLVVGVGGLVLCVLRFKKVGGR